MFTYRGFIDYAELLYSEAQAASSKKRANAYIIGSILNSWLSIESFINNMMQDFTTLSGDTYTVHERGFLEEKQVRFETEGAKAGTFCIESREEYRRIEDKILFLIAKFGKRGKVDKGASVWQNFEKMKEKRNNLTHPRRRREIELKLEDAQDAIEVAKSVIDFVSQEVWKKNIRW